VRSDDQATGDYLGQHLVDLRERYEGLARSRRQSWFALFAGVALLFAGAGFEGLALAGFLFFSALAFAAAVGLSALSRERSPVWALSGLVLGFLPLLLFAALADSGYRQARARLETEIRRPVRGAGPGTLDLALMGVALVALLSMSAFLQIRRQAARQAATNLVGEAFLPGASAFLPQVAAPAAPPADELATLRWTAYSPSGKLELRHSATGPARCQVECIELPGEARRWRAEVCLGKSLDFRFLSDDGERVVVLHPAPALAERWDHSEVAHVYRRGQLEYAVSAGTVLKSSGNSSRILSWLGGTLGRPGQPPRFSTDRTRVEFDTLEGKTLHIPLIAPPATPPGKPPLKAAGPSKKRRR
jgi:hypothetical protein